MSLSAMALWKDRYRDEYSRYFPTSATFVTVTATSRQIAESFRRSEDQSLVSDSTVEF